ncbi:MAG: sugar phosphate nucleotidyltransferase [Anaerolineae bacterium]|nr:sugar phosphate nucleotidyltransferase [Anaerolineae bacterium]MCO5199101.1 sugar phosphate nucleotidyltransferase [Anaerolineae bacterium]
MKVVIFAGGSGRRLWPISLKASPKQFEPIIGDKSTVQLAVDRVLDLVGAENIYISTNQAYLPIIAAQLPMIPTENLIGEPTRRDLAAAVGLAMVHLARAGATDEPVAILWGDNYMDAVPTFQRVLQTAGRLITADRAQITFMGETPRFANDQLGWIGLNGRAGEVEGLSYYGFGSLTYRPASAECRRMFAAGSHVWNTGYFVTTVAYIQAQYERHAPEMWASLTQIGASIGTNRYDETLQRLYPTLDVISFDDAILRHIDPHDALVLHADMGWSDPGTLYALKEAINSDATANVVRGLVEAYESQDCLLYNYEQGKLLAAVGLEGMIVVNTDHAVLVVHKDSIPLVKKLVNGMVGTELELYT